MWDELGADGFLKRTAAKGEPAIARTVIGFCDGMKIETYVGETKGTIAQAPRGNRDFYWDTIFCPDFSPAKTYAEIVESAGLQKKLAHAQSYRAIRRFVQAVSKRGGLGLFNT